jgi:hypothetical protein
MKSNESLAKNDLVELSICSYSNLNNLVVDIRKIYPQFSINELITKIKSNQAIITLNLWNNIFEEELKKFNQVLKCLKKQDAEFKLVEYINNEASKLDLVEFNNILSRHFDSLNSFDSLETNDI